MANLRRSPACGWEPNAVGDRLEVTQRLEGLEESGPWSSTSRKATRIRNTTAAMAPALAVQRAARVASGSVTLEVNAHTSSGGRLGVPYSDRRTANPGIGVGWALSGREGANPASSLTSPTILPPCGGVAHRNSGAIYTSSEMRRLRCFPPPTSAGRLTLDFNGSWRWIGRRTTELTAK